MFSATRTGKLQGAAIVSAVFGAVLHAIPAWATVSPSSLEFGDVPFGGPSNPQSVSITAPKGAAFSSSSSRQAAAFLSSRPNAL